MRNTELLQVLMHRENCTAEEALDLIESVREDVEMEGLEEALYMMGLEPDYADDLMEHLA